MGNNDFALLFQPQAEPPREPSQTISGLPLPFAPPHHTQQWWQDLKSLQGIDTESKALLGKGGSRN